MIDYSKGGRGKIAPYQTSHCRVPLDIKPLCEQLSIVYKRFLSFNSPELINKFIRTIQESISEASYPEHKPVNGIKSKDEALKIAKKVLSQKKSARVSLAKLLTAIYDVEIKPEDLGGVEK